MRSIEARRAVVHLLPYGVRGQAILHAAHQMSQRMTTEGVRRQQYDVRNQHQCADSEAERLSTGRIGEPHGLPCVPAEDRDEEERQVEEVPMQVLQDER